MQLGSTWGVQELVLLAFLWAGAKDAKCPAVPRTVVYKELLLVFLECSATPKAENLT